MKNKNQILDDALSSAERVQFEKMQARHYELFKFYVKIMFAAIIMLALGLVIAYFEWGFESHSDAAIFVEKIGNAAAGFIFAGLCCVANHSVFDLKFYD